MGLFIDDVDDRVMRIGMTVSSDQKVIFGNGKSLGSHGSTDGRSIFSPKTCVSVALSPGII